MISSALLQKIKNSINLVHLIHEHICLEKKGNHYVGLCPFHHEKTPSFAVNEAHQFYHCFGCKRGGDIFTYLQETQGLSFYEAVEEIAQRAQISLPIKNAVVNFSLPHQVEKKKKQALAYRLNHFVAAFFHTRLKKNEQVLAYLADRGVGEVEIRAYYLGLAPDSSDALLAYLKNAKAPLDLASELGLIRASQRKKGNYFDGFRNRIIFPILNRHGKISGFGARSLNDEHPKYLNSTESFIFKKSQFLYGLYQNQKFIRQKDQVLLVEGYFDLIALSLTGFCYAVATCGTALTREHLLSLKRFTSNVIVLFDGDEAGRLATERAMQLGLEMGWVLQGVFLPEGQDPASFLIDSAGKPDSKAPAVLQEMIQQADFLLDMKIQGEIKKALTAPETQTKALKNIVGWLALLQDSMGCAVRVEKISQHLGISKDLILKAIQKQKRYSKGSLLTLTKHSLPVLVQPQSISPWEIALFKGMVQREKFTQRVKESFSQLPSHLIQLTDLFESKKIQQWVLQKIENFNTYSELEDDTQLKSLMAQALLDSNYFQEEEFEKILEKIIWMGWMRVKKRLKGLIVQAENSKNKNEFDELLKTYSIIQRKIKE